MRGYKVFNPDWTCREFKYEVGKTYELDGELKICKSGFHFCEKASDCFNYYSFDIKNKVAEVEALGEVQTEENKSCTNKIKIVREIPWQELLTIVNEGKDNTGLCNTGNCNTGNWNTGNCNTGNCNTGDWNTGSWNAGSRNTGNCNTGNCNTGNRNTGDWNSTNYSSGVFCTEEAKILLFNKPSNLTLREWRGADAYYMLQNIKTVFWVYSENMTDQEKELYPEHETTGGFLKTVHLVEAAEKWWNELDDEEKQVIKDIPNFDAKIFYDITGIIISKEEV